MPFGFGKKKEDKASKGGDNPYAQSSGGDPYTDNAKYANASPYQQARQRLNDPAAGPSRTPSYASNVTAPPAYQERSQPQGYSNDAYGAPSGYGSNKYASQGGPGASRQGGYGGLGPSTNDDEDANRDALFGGARERQAIQAHKNAPSPAYNNSQPGAQPYGASSAYGAPSASGADSGKYGGYGEQRELTAEEQENAEVDDLNRQRREVVQQSVQSTQNSARYKNEALDAAMSTYARLGVQHERLTNTEQLLDHGAISSREAKTSTAELKRLNGSMFNPNLKNPFTAKKRREEQEQRVLKETQDDRDMRLGTRKDGYLAQQREEAGFREIQAAKGNNSWKPASATERSKYMFEDEDDPDAQADEEAIERNLHDISGGVSQLNVAAKLINKELDSQNQLIDRLGNKSEALHDQTALNTARLNKIR